MIRSNPFLLSTAINITSLVCGVDLDPLGEPVIQHPLRVMMAVDFPPFKETAVLHDVLEDSPLTPACLILLGISPKVVEKVVILTRRKEEPYTDYIGRVIRDPVATYIKLVDLSDNLSRLMVNSYSPEHKEWAKYLRSKYTRTLEQLGLHANSYTSFLWRRDGEHRRNQVRKHFAKKAREAWGRVDSGCTNSC